VTVRPASPIKPGRYQLNILAASPPNALNFKTTVTVS
jgi:hypothetical protein